MTLETGMRVMTMALLLAACGGLDAELRIETIFGPETRTGYERTVIRRAIFSEGDLR
jgi:hypothetical protein